MRHLLVICALLALFLPGSAFSDNQERCAGCGKAITEGSWIEAGGKYYHSNHFVCSICRQPIGTGKFQIEDGRLYDSTCYVNEVLPRCGYCGQPVGFEWVTFEGKPYHRNCFEEHVALKCSLCGEIIEGPYIQDQWGNSYHEAHRDEPRCLYCGRLLTAATDGGEIYSDGRTVCGLCLVDAVKSDTEAKQIMNNVKGTLADAGITIDRKELPLKLVDRERLADIIGGQRDKFQLEGCTYFEKRSVLYGLVSRQKFNIYILYGLPRVKYIAAIAHELMHVWLGLNAPLEQNQAMVEGSCNYAASLVLKQLGTDEGNRLLQTMLESQDRDYGEGYRQVMSQVDKRGLDGWLDYLKDHSAPPW